MKTYEERKNVKGYKNLRKYLKYFPKYKWLCFGFWLCLIITGVIGFFAPIVLGKVISEMTVTRNFAMAKTQAIHFALLEIIAILIDWIRTPLFKKLENYVKRDVKLSVVKDSFDINIGEFEKLGNGTFITRLTSDLDSLAMSFKNISETVVNFVSKIGFIIFIFVINYWLGIFLVAFILLRYFIYQIRIYYFVKMKPGVLKKSENINSVIGESVRGIKDIKTLGLGDSVVQHIHKLQLGYMKADNDEWNVGVGLCSAASVVRTLCNMCFIFLCVFLIRAGRLDLAVFYSVYVYKNSVMDFAVHLGELQNYFKEVEVSAERVFQLTDENLYSHDIYGDVEVDKCNGNIEFKHVSFCYSKEQGILDDVSFKIKNNTHVAFVGESGCGKSTIVSLICRLYSPQDGVIFFDNVNSTELSKSFCKNVSMINQSPYLFNMTIKENMHLVKPDATDEEIFNVLKIANADEFVRRLPKGLDSFLGEGGARLSGGQKQRLCIARALLKDSKIMIFDEATSSLDNISQKIVMDNIETIKKDKTIITIAHRLSTIENCDQIYFIDKGKIVAHGKHKYLLKNNTRYAALYNKQKRDKLSENK